MTLISYLKTCKVNLTITSVHYTEGANKFDEWYALVRQKFPNAKEIHCSGNGLKTLNCPGALIVYCNDNNLTELKCNNAIIVHCFNNKLPNICLLSAQYIYCQNNKIVYMICPNAIHIKCDNNRLSSITNHNVSHLYCHNNPLKSINCPRLETLQYDVYNDNKPIMLLSRPRYMNVYDKDRNSIR